MSGSRFPLFDVGWEDRFLSMERAGRSAREIAAAFNVSPRTVTRWRGIVGTNREAPRRKPNDVREVARRMLADGCSFAETARTVGAHPTTVRVWFPDVPAWSRVQAAEYAVQVRRFNRVEARNAAA